MIPRYGREYHRLDLRRALLALFHTSPRHTATTLPLFPNVKTYLTHSGRESLYIILQGLDLPPGSGIGVPLFTCTAVFQAIAAAGHRPIFLDLDPETYDVDVHSVSRKRSQIDALIVPHTFGYPSDIDVLRNCLGRRNIPIIEDCAHALFSEYAGREVGTLGDAALFSFGNHKPAAMGGGGLLVANRPSLAERLDRSWPALKAESVWSELSHVAGCCLRSGAYSRAVYGLLVRTPLGRSRFAKKSMPWSDVTELRPNQWSLHQMRRVERALIETRLKEYAAALPKLSEYARRIRYFLDQKPLVIPPEPTRGKWNHFLLPVRYPSGPLRDSAREFLLQKGVDAGVLFPKCARLAVQFGYQNDCPQAEEITRTVCTIPAYGAFSDRETEHIGESFKRSFDWARSPGFGSHGSRAEFVPRARPN